MCIISEHSSSALQLSPVLWFGVSGKTCYKNHQEAKQHQGQNPSSIREPWPSESKSTLTFLSRSFLHPTKAPSLQSATQTCGLSLHNVPPTGPHSQPHTAPQVSPFPPASTFHGAYVIQVKKKDPFVSRQHLPQTSCTTPYLHALSKMTSWGPLVALGLWCITSIREYLLP